MKVLYIGYYKENSDWGRITENNILALDAAGVDVVCRSINLSQPRKISGRLAEIEQKDLSDCDFCIQHVFPDHLVGSKKFKKKYDQAGTMAAYQGKDPHDDNKWEEKAERFAKQELSKWM